jgi:REP element-mobilizing transposase RayT
MRYFNPREDIEKTHHKLPHWQQSGVPVAVTFRLSDSLPRRLLKDWLALRESFHLSHPPPWDDPTEAMYAALCTRKLELYLDAGHGCCALRDPRVRQIVADQLHHFDGTRYHLNSYVIMPNHVHVLFELADRDAIAPTLQGWKGVSSRYIKRAALCDLNPFWQPEYHDRLIRSPEHFHTTQDYIRQNPTKAGLREGTFLWWERSR